MAIKDAYTGGSLLCVCVSVCPCVCICALLGIKPKASCMSCCSFTPERSSAQGYNPLRKKWSSVLAHAFHLTERLHLWSPNCNARRDFPLPAVSSPLEVKCLAYESTSITDYVAIAADPAGWAARPSLWPLPLTRGRVGLS